MSINPRAHGILLATLLAITLIMLSIIMHFYTLHQSYVWLRVYRLLAALIGGSLLAVSGLALQASTSNILAEPSLLALSSGAYLAIALTYLFGYPIAYYKWGLGFTAWIGAWGGYTTTMLVYRVIGGTSGLELILAGVAVSAVLMGIGELIAYIVYTKTSVPLLTLALGTFAYIVPSDLVVLVITSITVIPSLFLLAPALNTLQFGDMHAASLGYKPSRIRVMATLIASLATGIVVSVSGVIGFIGLIAPNIARLLVGSDNKLLVPLSAVVGASILAFSDATSKLIGRVLGIGELPVGLLTGILGGLFLAASLKVFKRIELSQ